MAKEIIIRIKDDLDGELADTTVNFGYKGTADEIDLTAAHEAEFDEDIAKYVAVAHKVVPERPRKKSSAPRPVERYPVAEHPTLEQKRRIRVWANETGWTVTDKGVIARSIIEAYAGTHPDDPLLADTWGKYRRRRSRKAQSITAQQVREVSVTGEAAASLDWLLSGSRPDRFELSKQERRKVRDWAAVNGDEQARIGQIKTEVLEAYYTANTNGHVGVTA